MYSSCSWSLFAFQLAFAACISMCIGKRKWAGSRASSTLDSHPLSQAVRSDLIFGEVLSWYSGMQFTWSQLISQVITGHSHTWYEDSAWLGMQLSDAAWQWNGVTAVENVFMCPCLSSVPFVLNILCWLHSGNPFGCVKQMAHISPNFYFLSAESGCSRYLALVWIIDHFAHKKYRMETAAS